MSLEDRAASLDLEHAGTDLRSLFTLPEGVVYLEGVHVAPEERGRGRGLRCLSQLAGELLRRAASVCLLVNERNEAAHAFYRRAGFRFDCHYDTIFLRRA